jgi:hypothetical protein
MFVTLLLGTAGARSLSPEGEGPDGLSVHTPCVVRLHDGPVGMWYTSIPIEDEELGYRICLARFPGPWFT